MKKIAFIFGVFGAIVLTSCDKCQNCHYDSGNQQVEIGELCGDDLEDAENLGYYDNETDSLYEIHCEEH
ncbi:MAG: hypothetical protein R2780_05185 [Crocinitomicaceae bacterium]|nr:hypothetical protein [Crocinitomicaceae bacterium]